MRCFGVWIIFLKKWVPQLEMDWKKIEERRIDLDTLPRLG